MHGLRDPEGNGAIGGNADDEGAFAGKKSHGVCLPAPIMPERLPGRCARAS
jgi:hypothetical protein